MDSAPPDGHEIPPRTRRAVTAATVAGRDLGLRVEHPTILHDMFSVIVHLAPAPVVARVPVVMPPGIDQDTLIARQVRELSVVGWLGDADQPVVRPSPLVPRLPILRDGFSITLWELAEVDQSASADVAANAPLVAALHRALRSCPGDLPFLAPVALTVPSSLRFLADHPGLLPADDLERAQREWEVLEPILASKDAFADAVPGTHVQAIHGDAPYDNLLRTHAGPLHADFEDVCVGPVEWDMALAGPEAIAAYNAAAAAAGKRALDPVVLRIMEAARMLQQVAGFSLVSQLPVLAEMLAPMRDQWRTMPFAAGLG